MNKQGEYICPICGEDSLCTDFTDGTKWGRAYCISCDCGGPEVRTGYEESLDAPWREDARKQFVDVVNEHVIARPQPDPISGLVPCGCGCNPELRADDMGWYQVYCTGCDMHGGYSHTPNNVIEEWNEAMGWKGGSE